DRFGVDHPLPAGDRGERIEVDADEVERLDVLVVERVHVLGDVAAREDAGVDPGVERLHAACEHLRSRRHLLHARDGDAVLLQLRRGASGGDDLPAEVDEPAGERLDVRLVVDRDQRARHSAIISRTTVGRSRCSTTWIRSSSVAGGSTGSASWRSTRPVSRPSSTRWIVTPVFSTFASSASLMACMPGKAGNNEGWTFTIRFGNRSRNGFVSRCMYPARTTSSTSCSSSQVAITRSRSSRSAWQSRLKVAVGTPALRARTSA